MTRGGTRLGVGMLAASVLALAACSPQDSSADAPLTAAAEVPTVADAALDRTPGAGIDPSSVEVDELLLPIQSEGADLVSPGWETIPHYLDGVFMSPVDEGGYLEFTAIDATGKALWSLERPLACAGFTLTAGANGQSLAVINDAVTTDDSLAATTASAYDLHTGELIWGPVEVPGPHQGPGLVYAAPSEAAMGAGGPRVALSPITGEVLVNEETSDWSIVAESHGIVLLSSEDWLQAVDAHGAQLWQTPLPSGLVTAQAAAGVTPGDGVQVLQGPEGSLTVLSLASGDVLAELVTSAAADTALGLLVVTDATRTFAVSLETGESLWQSPSSADARVVTAAGAMAYVRDGDAIRVHNTMTGDIMPGYPEALSGVIAVPLVMTGTGAAAFAHEGDVLLATAPGS